MIMQAPDTISGKEGTVTAIIDGKVEELMELANITATVEKEKTPVRVLGQRNTQNKTTGWSGTGSGTVRYVSSRWLKLMERYVKTGKDTYFTLTITNDDPGSNAGRQVVQLLGCNLDSIDIAKLDVDTEILDQDINFTFDDFNTLDEFNSLV